VLPISIISPLSNKVISSSCTQAAKILEEIRTIYSNMQALTKYFYDFLMMKEKKKRVRKNQAESFNNRTKDNFIAAQLRRIKSNQT
jgi:flagellar biosynthesis chaperone FliJ